MTIAVGHAAVLAATLWWFWPTFGDPLDHLPGPSGLLKVVGIREWKWQGRIIYDLTIDTGPPGRSRIAVSLPDPLPARPVPVVFVMAGAKMGLTAVAKFDRPGNNVVAAYEYPFDKRDNRFPWLLLKLPALRAQALDVPGQAVGGLNWLRGQTWADRARVTPIGFSLGAVYMPAVLRLDERYGDRAGSDTGRAVIAYGGANIATLAAEGLRFEGFRMAELFGWLVGKSLRPLEPAEHLTRLKGEFLVVGSVDRDAMVPSTASRLLEELVPHPKTVMHLPGGHIGDEAATTASALVEVAHWLLARGAVQGP